MHAKTYLETLKLTGNSPAAKDLRLLVGYWHEDLFDGKFKDLNSYLNSIEEIVSFLMSVPPTYEVNAALEYWQYLALKKHYRLAPFGVPLN